MSVFDAWGPKGRFPWISLNGEHLGDTTIITEFLKKSEILEKQLSENYYKFL